MTIQIKALLAGFVGTILLGFIIIPILKKLKIGQVVRSDGPKEHLKKSGTPTMGGIIMLIVIIAVSSLIVYRNGPSRYGDMLPVAFVTLRLWFNWFY